MRVQLSDYIRNKGYSPTETTKLMGVSYYSIINELKKGLAAEDFKNGRYVKYSPLDASYNEVYTILCDEGMEAVYKKWKEEKKQ